ncbi:MarR family winged helix-turn-helix transcriptional regulator [Nonomuraea antimicrobica]
MNFDDPRLTAVGLLAEVHSGLMGRLAPVLNDAGLSEIDFETAIRLARSPHQRLRMSDLAAQIGLSTSGVTRVVDRLEREGLVTRRRAPPTGARRTPRSPPPGVSG